MAIEIHLDGQEQVPGFRDGLGEGHHPTVVAHLSSGEKALLIASGDGQLHAIPRDSTGGAHAENHCGHLDVGGEREVVVGYSQRQPGALRVLMARQALTAAERQVDRETGRGLAPPQQAEKQQSVGKRGSLDGTCFPSGQCSRHKEHRHSPGGGAVDLQATDSGTSLFQHPLGHW